MMCLFKPSSSAGLLRFWSFKIFSRTSILISAHPFTWSKLWIFCWNIIVCICNKSVFTSAGILNNIFRVHNPAGTSVRPWLSTMSKYASIYAETKLSLVHFWICYRFSCSNIYVASFTSTCTDLTQSSPEISSYLQTFCWRLGFQCYCKTSKLIG